MVYDTALADRVRDELAPRAPFEERAMFGGLVFMVNTHMACGIIHDDLMVRLGREAHDDALARGAREMDFTGRPMRGIVVVDASLLDADGLADWLEESVLHAESQPPKAPRARTRPR